MTCKRQNGYKLKGKLIKRGLKLNCAQGRISQERCVYKVGLSVGIHAKQGWGPVPRPENKTGFSHSGHWQSMLRPRKSALTQDSRGLPLLVDEGLAKVGMNRTSQTYHCCIHRA